jgi:hypothetical protein
MVSAGYCPVVGTRNPHRARGSRSAAPASSAQDLPQLIGRLLLFSAAGATGSLVGIIGLLLFGGILGF